MEDCLFRFFSRKENVPRDVLDRTYHYTGFGFNQKAFSTMANSYKDGADQLADSQSHYNVQYNTDLIYPIFFCYRQSLELILKAVICNLFIPINRARSNQEGLVIRERLNGHGLMDLFNRIRRRIEDKGVIGSYYQLLTDIRPYVEAFDNFDRTSFGMRYPAGKDLASVKSQEDLMRYDIQYTSEHYDHVWKLLRELYEKSLKDWSDGLFVV